MVAAAADIGASRSAPANREGRSAPVDVRPAGAGDALATARAGLCMPKVASWQLLLTFPAGPTSPWPRSSEKSIEQKAQRRISVYVVRATSYDPFAKRVVTEKILGVSNQSVTAAISFTFA
jgi:hypothetical protein